MMSIPRHTRGKQNDGSSDLPRGRRPKKSAGLKVGLALVLLSVSLVWIMGAPPAAALGMAMGMMPTKGTPAAVEFSLPSMKDKPVSLKEFRGRAVLLNFWATWCPPCRLEMPSMQTLYDQYKERGLTILAVSVDKQGAAIVDPFLEKYKLTFPVALDVDMKVMDQYKVRGLPSTIIIDGQGRQHGIIVGPRDWHGKAAKRLVEEMLDNLNKAAAK